MDQKEQLEKQLDTLKEIGISRQTVSLDLGYGKTYVSEILGPNGKITDSFMEVFQPYFMRRTQHPPQPPMSIRILNDEENSSPYLIPLPSPYKDCDFLYKARGDSMYPKIPNGAEVGVRRIEDIEVIISGEIYVIFTSNKLSTIRYIHMVEGDPDAIDLVPYNEKAKTTRIKKADIAALFKAEFVLTLI